MALWTTLASTVAWAAGPSIDTKWQSKLGGDGASELTLTVTVERGWHLNANDPDRPYLIPTVLEVTAPTGTTVASIAYPDAVLKKLAFAPDTSLRLYDGTFAIRVRITGTAPGRLDAALSYQACSDETCLPPRTLPVPYEATK